MKAMKVKFFPCATKGLNWRVVNDPFLKIQCDLIFGRNKRDKCFIPLVGLSDLSDGQFVSVSKNARGTNVIKPSVADDTTDILLFTTIEGGFRGGVSLYRNDGSTIIAQATASAACESAIAVAAIMPVNDPPSMLVFRETGRYGTVYHTYRARVNEVAYTKLSKGDFEFLFEGGQDLES